MPAAVLPRVPTALLLRPDRAARHLREKHEMMEIPEQNEVWLRPMAERVGFEPTRPVLRAYTISSRAPSTNSAISPPASIRARVGGVNHWSRRRLSACALARELWCLAGV